MSPYKNILIALDTSDEAKQVVLKARALAECFQANITLIHVVEPIVMENSYDMINTLPIDIENSLIKRAEEFFGKIKSEFSIDAESIVTTGLIKTVVFKQVSLNNFDLIVVGSHGRHGLALLLGSTATKLIHGSPCDIHVVRIVE